jgi:predicted TIM-barrel fold metal-dependent hydrolase
MIMPIKALEGIDALRLDDEVKAMFLSENARRVFKLESGG